MATGGAEQERKGAPWCVRVSVPARPELCLSDRQRREKKTREKRRGHSAKTRREKFACPKPIPDKNPGVVGGGWVHRQVVSASRWPLPSGQATEERRQKKRTEERSRAGQDKGTPKSVSEPHSQPKKNYPKETTGYVPDELKGKRVSPGQTLPRRAPKTEGTFPRHNLQPRREKRQNRS